MQRLSKKLSLLALLMSASMVAVSPADNWLQLHQFNQTNQQKLRNLQEDYSKQQALADSPAEQLSRQQLNRQQKLQQQSLQRDQLNMQRIQNQRDRSYPADHSSRLERNSRQQRFRQEQQWQLQRFKSQQQLRIRPR